MYQKAYRDKWVILPDDHERFFEIHVIDVENYSYIQKAPRILPFLAEWLDQTCPGRWTTVWYKDIDVPFSQSKAILVGDESIFSLFKLAWHDHANIQRQREIDQTVVYCPYVPLTITSATQQGQ